MNKYVAPDYPLVIIGVDPGRTTGISVFGVPKADVPARHIRAAQWTDIDLVAYNVLELQREWEDEGNNVVVVCEQFDKRPGIVDPDLTPMFIIRDLTERYAYTNPIVWQTPSQAKNLVKPAGGAKGVKQDQLKRFGWYTTGMPHANDATRHVIVYLTEKIKHAPTINVGWPRRDGV